MKDFEQIMDEFQDKYCVIFNGKPSLNDDFFSAIKQYVIQVRIEEQDKFIIMQKELNEHIAKLNKGL